jgi:hypothetical protein
MDWLSSTLASLADNPVIGYARGQSPATEPTAIAALGLIAAGQPKQAAAGLDFLVACQGSDGAVGIRQSESSPGWPTSLAVLAWRAFDEAGGRNAYASQLRQAVNWILEARGTAMPQSPEMGHNTQLVAWSWADKTHSWIEPTALNILALKRAGLGTHARVREAIRLLVDRLLPAGGCNYGNTVVLGQTLRPHVQPTGLAMLALAGESSDSANRARRSLAYLQRALVPPVTATSLSWALLALRAHGIELPNAAELLATAHHHVQAHDRSPHKLAPLALAAQDSSLALLVSGRGRPG